MNSKTAVTAFAFLTALTLMATGGSAGAQGQRDQARANFVKADINKDSFLDSAEFQTFINLNADLGLGRAPTIRRFNAYARAFAELDKNRDGKLSREEIAAVANQ